MPKIEAVSFASAGSLKVGMTPRYALAALRSSPSASFKTSAWVLSACEYAGSQQTGAGSVLICLDAARSKAASVLSVLMSLSSAVAVAAMNGVNSVVPNAASAIKKMAKIVAD